VWRQYRSEEGTQETESSEMEGPLRQHVHETGLSLSRQVRRWRARSMITAVDTNVLLDILVPNEQVARLLSRDRGFYRKLFPSLDLRDPVAL